LANQRKRLDIPQIKFIVFFTLTFLL